MPIIINTSILFWRKNYYFNDVVVLNDIDGKTDSEFTVKNLKEDIIWTH